MHPNLQRNHRSQYLEALRAESGQGRILALAGKALILEPGSVHQGREGLRMAKLTNNTLLSNIRFTWSHPHLPEVRLEGTLQSHLENIFLVIKVIVLLHWIWGRSQTSTSTPSKCFLPVFWFFFFYDVYTDTCFKNKIKVTIENPLFLHSTYTPNTFLSLNAKAWI